MLPYLSVYQVQVVLSVQEIQVVSVQDSRRFNCCLSKSLTSWRIRGHNTRMSILVKHSNNENNMMFFLIRVKHSYNLTIV